MNGSFPAEWANPMAFQQLRDLEVVNSSVSGTALIFLVMPMFEVLEVMRHLGVSTSHCPTPSKCKQAQQVQCSMHILGDVVEQHMFKHLHAQYGCQESTCSHSSIVPANLLYWLMQAQSLPLGRVLAPSPTSTSCCSMHCPSEGLYQSRGEAMLFRTSPS